MLYIYGIARPNPGQPVVALPQQGILPDCPVVALVYRDLLAMMSVVPDAVFEAEAIEQNLRNDAWVRDRVLDHQRVLTELLAGYTVAPLSFCTLYRSKARVEEMLAQHYSALDAVLQRLAGASEWGVKLHCEHRAVVAWAAEHAPELAEQRAAMSRASQGAAFFLRKKLAQAADELAAHLIASVSAETRQRLRVLARAEAILPPTPQVQGQPNSVVLNAAYLVDHEQHSAFSTTLDTLAASYTAQGFMVVLSGPWPPYSFSELAGDS